MPVSRHRKDHKKKVNKYKTDAKIAKKRLQEQMMKEYFEKVQASQQLKKQENSELVTSDDINIDLDVDLNNLLDQTTPIIEEAIIIEEPVDVMIAESSIEEVSEKLSEDVENK